MKNQKITLRSLKEELDSLREQLHENKINVSKLKQDRETRSMAVPEVTIYNLLLKPQPQAFSFECLYLKKTTGNLSIYVPHKC